VNALGLIIAVVVMAASATENQIGIRLLDRFVQYTPTVSNALGIGTAAKDIEGLRAKLKRLVARGALTEAEPGLFTLSQPAASDPDPTPGP
jgi:hypothetical protein